MYDHVCIELKKSKQQPPPPQKKKKKKKKKLKQQQISVSELLANCQVCCHRLMRPTEGSKQLLIHCWWGVQQAVVSI